MHIVTIFTPNSFGTYYNLPKKNKKIYNYDE